MDPAGSALTGDRFASSNRGLRYRNKPGRTACPRAIVWRRVAARQTPDSSPTTTETARQVKPAFGLRARIAAALLVAFAAGGITIALRHNSIVEAVEGQTIDLRFAIRGAVRPPRDIVIVALDTTSQESLPQYPFSRRIDARALEQLHRAGARVIVYDFSVDRPTTAGADSALFYAAADAAPVVFGATDIGSGPHNRGQTFVLGGNANVRSIHDYVGAALLPDDPDGTVRHLVGEVNGLPSIASVVQRIVTGHATSPRGIARTGSWIDYSGPPGTFPRISLYRVLSGHFDPRAVRGKIVVIGATTPVLHDDNPTAAGGGAMPGPEIQANAIATMLDGLPLRNAPSWLQIALILAAPLAICAVAIRGGALWVSLAGLVSLVAWCLGAAVAFDGGSVLEFTPEVVAIALATGGALAIGAVADARERRELRRLFAAGSPALVSQVLSGDSPLRAWASRIIDGYHLEEQISRGGMGAVYVATQQGLSRRVALKVILPEYAQSAEHRARFELECRAAAAIEHPNVIPVYDTGNNDRVLYIAMRLVTGGDLSAELDVPLDPLRAIRIVEQIAGALDAAHSLNIVHRDVKPSNVLITSDEPEHVYLTDFGIAKWLGESGQLTRADGWIGTATYAAPEQIRGDEVDGRTDVYSLAAVLYHCLTGETPYPRENRTATAIAHLSEPVPKPTAVNPYLPAEIDAVMAIGLAKLPGDRFATAADLVRAAAMALGVASNLGRAPATPAGSGMVGAPVERPATVSTSPGSGPTRLAAAPVPVQDQTEPA